MFGKPYLYFPFGSLSRKRTSATKKKKLSTQLLFQQTAKWTTKLCSLSIQPQQAQILEEEKDKSNILMFTFPIVATFRISLNNHQILIVVVIRMSLLSADVICDNKKLASMNTVENNEQYSTATTTNQ